VKVTGNTIRNPNSYGIYLISISGDNPGAALKNVTITGYTVIDPGNSVPSSGIAIGQAAISGGISVIGNTIADDRTPCMMPFGVEVFGFPTNLAINSNQISGFATAAYSF
jgi:hypothetical protein